MWKRSMADMLGHSHTKLLIGSPHNPKYRLRPVLDRIHHHIEPIREELGWGFDLPDMTTGLLTQDPRAATVFNAGNDRGDIVKFFDPVVGSE